MSGVNKDGAAYRAWERAIRDLDPEALPKGRRKLTLYAVAVAIASYGKNGKGCWPAQTTLADKLGCSRTVINKYRTLLIDLGWFTYDDDTQRRLSIAVPDSSRLSEERCSECGKRESDCEGDATCWRGKMRLRGVKLFPDE
jgi:hypothetical protein